MSDLLRNGVKFQFNEEQRIAMHTLKERISDRPVLTIFRYGAETELHTDASKFALGAILFQRDYDDGQMHPVQYYSRKTSINEQKYHSYELEALAVVKAVKKIPCVFTWPAVQSYHRLQIIRGNVEEKGLAENRTVCYLFVRI